MKRICTGASQWANRTWDVTIKGRGYLVDGKLLAVDCEQSYWDGNNMHHRSDEPYILGSEPDWDDLHTPGWYDLHWLPGKETRQIAARLPQAIARYMQECSDEAAANNNTVLRAGK